MFSLYSLSPRSSSAFSLRLRNSRPFRIAEAAWAATAFSTSTSSLLRGSWPSLRPGAEHGDHLALDAAGEQPGQRSRGLGLLGAAAGRGRPAGRPAAARRAPASAGAGRSRAARQPLHAVGREAAVLARQEDRHLAHAERRADALQQALGGALEVEVGVEVLGQPHQRLARGVAFLVRQPLEALLDARLDGREEQYHHQRAQQRDRRGVRLLPQHVGDADRQQREPDDHRYGQHVAERATEDQLHVHQPVLDHRVGQRQRDQRERAVAHQLHWQARLAAEREGQRVEGEEGESARGRAPDQPLHLPPRRDVARAAVGAQQHAEGGAEQQREVQRLGRVDRLHDGPQPGGGLAATATAAGSSRWHPVTTSAGM